MAGVRDFIAKAALTSATVLIAGESGTGKELVARAVHYSSNRASAPFVPVNCGAIPEELLESELFGHMKGAFTGAIDSRAGFFQTADGGTIFLDEISETSLNMQIKLLRVLQDKEVCMVGSAAQEGRCENRSIHEQTLCPLRTFRQDLFRVNVLAIELPPLRSRDTMLIRYFSERLAEEMEQTYPGFSSQTLQVLQNYHKGT